MIRTAVARRYAKALFGLIDAGQIEATRNGLIALAAAVHDSAQLRHVIASPTFTLSDKRNVLVALSQWLGCPPIADSFLTQLLKKNRVGFLKEIAEEFAILADQRRGTQAIEISSAAPLAPSDQEHLRTRLRELVRHDVNLTFHTEPKLLAGLQIRIGSTVFDNTVYTRLSAMRTLVTKE